MSRLTVLYNGATGGLGRWFGEALRTASCTPIALSARLGDETSTIAELQNLRLEPESPVVFMQSAGLVPVAECEADPGRAYAINVEATARTAELVMTELADRSIATRVLFLSSGHVYAPPADRQRIGENAPVGPRSVYAETKLLGEQRLAVLAKHARIPFSAARIFGVVGPAQRADYVLPGLIRRVRAGDVRAVPGLDNVRDYLDARDVARHLADLALLSVSQSLPQVVNVCSGEETTIRSLVDLVIEELGVRGLQPAAADGRPTDIPWVVGDPTLLTTLTETVVRNIPLSDSIADAVEAADAY